MISDKPILLPDRYQALQPTFEWLQREILKPMEVFSKDPDGYAIDRVALGDFADDTAAQAGGVPVGGLYRNGSQLMVRVS
jgi:hypothetical protein